MVLLPDPYHKNLSFQIVMSENKEKEVLGSKDVPDLRFLSAKEKFNLLMPERRIQLLKAMGDEDAAKLHYDWEFNGRPKQMAPDYEKSRATSFCMCAYLSLIHI